MSDPWLQSNDEKPSYRVELLLEAKPGPGGIHHRRAGERTLLPWSRIQRAIAAEIGEPEGVRTIVFDLLVESDGTDCLVYRFDADPGEDAMAVARELGAGLGPERATASIKSVATDGIPSRWYPDIESFEYDAFRGLTSG